MVCIFFSHAPFRSDFLSLPFQVIECSLAGVNPAGRCGEKKSWMTLTAWHSGDPCWPNCAATPTLAQCTVQPYDNTEGKISTKLDWGGKWHYISRLSLTVSHSLTHALSLSFSVTVLQAQSLSLCMLSLSLSLEDALSFVSYHDLPLCVWLVSHSLSVRLWI